MAAEMEAVILKFICANSGAVHTEELINIGVCDSATVTDIIRNQEKFATVCVRGQPKVVARTRLRLCAVVGCTEGSCKALHLCKNLVFDETCNFRGPCRFSHQLDSPHNQELLRTHGLESLNRAELCTLLLQNDGSLLPLICFGYNKGDGVRSECNNEHECKMLHICRRSLHGPCGCPRDHDFTAPQPAKRLKDKRLPEHLIPTLRTVYLNKGALIDLGKKGRKAGAAGGRVRRRGNRGKGGESRPPQHRAASACSVSSDRSRNDSGSGNDSGSDSDATTASDVSSVVYDSDASSGVGRRRTRRSLGASRDDGEPEGVAAPVLTLCRARNCAGTCRTLHLCKNVLFSGSCSFALQNRCTFSHTLDSEHNREILKEHHLENLNQAELCKLLLSCDDALLPQICHDYNNGDGLYGMCPRGEDCQRLHVCEKFLHGPCSCLRPHDLGSPQPRRVLRGKGFPDQLIYSLKSVYVLKQDSRRGAHGARNPGAARGRGGNRGNRGGGGNQGLFAYPDQGPGGFRGRGRGGNQGNRGGGGNQFAYPDQGPGGFRGRGRGGNQGNRGGGGNQWLLANPDQYLGGFRGRGRGDSYGNRGRGNSHQPQPPTDGIPAAAAATTAAGATTGAAAAAATATATAAAAGDVAPERRHGPVRDKTEICMYFIKDYCKHGDACFKAHDKMPYRWQVRRDDQWSALPDNESIEKDYCDPKKTRSIGSPSVDFDTMTCGTDKVRRLSTINSVLAPSFIHTTEWAWYWENEHGTWKLYESPNSTELEEKFQQNDQDVVEFTGSNNQLYSLSFSDMLQTNRTYSTKRLVKRRPKFVSEAEVKTKKMRKPADPSFTGTPDHWDGTQIPKTGYKTVCLQQSSHEYSEIESLFCKTMKGFNICKIARIQNKELWEIFQWKRIQMKNKNGGKFVAERKLFHGTEKDHVHGICNTNFDWRICGKNGTLYGQGCYFARDAKYSHSYTGKSDVRSMFIVRVLIGTYTKGSSDVVRPDVNRFDSCVDDVHDPSIFVVFEQPQVYPEYLLEYRVPSTPTQSSSGVQSPSSGYQSASSGVRSSSTLYQSSSSTNPFGSSGVQSSSSGYQSASSGVRSSSTLYQSSSSTNPFGSSGVQSSSSGYQSGSSDPSLMYGYSASQSRSTTSSSTSSGQRTSSPVSPPVVPKKAPDTCVIA